jgi:hypothetical protein
LPIWQNIFQASGLEPLTPLVDLDWAWVNSYGQAVEQDCGGIRKMPFMPSSLAGHEVPCDSINSSSGPQIDSVEKETKGGSSWFDWLF